MDEMKYRAYISRANEADEIYKQLADIYGFSVPWKQRYFMAVKDKLLTKEQKNLVKEFHPVK